MNAIGYRHVELATGADIVVAVGSDGNLYPVAESIRELLASDAAAAFAALDSACDGTPLDAEHTVLAPVDVQEVWASGVTYGESRSARMAESISSKDVYERVFDADRPELFFKAPAYRVPAPGTPLRIRHDSEWNVPEPELGVVFAADGGVVGYLVGNDMSSRSIERENPLYLPQAKIYDGATGLSDTVILGRDIDPQHLKVELRIERHGTPVFSGTTSTSFMQRTIAELGQFLFRELEFVHGVVLLTGTGIVPPDGFTLDDGDVVTISIPSVGELHHPVYRSAAYAAAGAAV